MPFTLPALIAAGRLAGVAVACGFNLYATVAFLGIASRAGWFVLPPGLRGLENTIVIASAAALYVAETVIDKFPYVDAVWEAVHTLIRPLAAGLLAGLAVSGVPSVDPGVVAALVALLTLAGHGAKAGLRVAARTPARPMMRFGLSVAEDAAAIGLAAAALLYPQAAAILAAVIALIMILAGPGLWRAGLLGLRAFVSRLRGFFGDSRWRTSAEVPAGYRRAIAPDPHGLHPARAARAAVYGLPRVGAYRNGWLVIERDGPSFVYRSMFRTRRLGLAPAPEGRVRRGLMLDVLEIENLDRRYAIFLLKDGPAAEAALAEMIGSTP